MSRASLLVILLLLSLLACHAHRGPSHSRVPAIFGVVLLQAAPEAVPLEGAQVEVRPVDHPCPVSSRDCTPAGAGWRARAVTGASGQFHFPLLTQATGAERQSVKLGCGYELSVLAEGYGIREYTFCADPSEIVMTVTSPEPSDGPKPREGSEVPERMAE